MLTPDAPTESPVAESVATVPASPPRRRRRRLWAFLWEWSKAVQLAFIIFLLSRAFLIEMFKIPSGSMESTLLVGDFLVVNKLLYGAELPFIGTRLPAVRDPAAGDVVVFRWPEDPSKSFVKRLVGLPNDIVEMREGTLFRNGTAQHEVYAVHRDVGFDPASAEFRWQRDFVAPGVDVRRYHPSRNNWGPLVVPLRQYFMLGDNRDNSLDSRYWGFVPDSLIRGSPIMVYYSFSPDSSESFAWLTRVRWQRLGELIR